MAQRAATTSRMSAVERREQLLDVAKAIVSDDGFHAVSIEAVAREAGITRPIVYGHFRDLAGLLEALVDREGARALAQLATVLPDDLAGGDPRELLLAALGGYLETVRSDRATWRLVLMPQEGAPKKLHEHIARGRTAIVAQLARAVRPGFGPAGESPDPELTARMLSAFADEAARLLLTEPQHYPVERLLAHARWVLEQLPSASYTAATDDTA
jgi:AcrR family transcriptional regulator